MLFKVIWITQESNKNMQLFINNNNIIIYLFIYTTKYLLYLIIWLFIKFIFSIYKVNLVM